MVNVQKRAPQTSAICDSNYVWMDNGRQQSPCLVAAYALGACQGGQWTIQALQPDHHYNAPNGTTVDRCSCSWAVYNLINGCTVCQNQLASVVNWSPYIQNCPRELQSSTFWSPQITFPQDSAIPYWATQDPTKWPSARFDIDAAKSLASQGRPDVTPSGPESTAKKSTPAGAIAGGVVGGVVGLAVIIIAFFLYKRYKARKEKEAQEQRFSQQSMSIAGTYTDIGSPYSRVLKPPSGADLSYTRLDSTSPISTAGYTTSPFTVTHAHNSSITTFSAINGPGSAVPMSPPSSPPPLPVGSQSSVGAWSRGNVPNSSGEMSSDFGIQPFTLAQSNNGTPQFTPDGKVRPIGYDAPTMPPSGATSIPMDVAPNVPANRRFNPPPYSPALDQQEGELMRATPMRLESKSGPSASTQTLVSSAGAPMTRNHRGHQLSTSTQQSPAVGLTLGLATGGSSVSDVSGVSGVSVMDSSAGNEVNTTAGEGTPYGTDPARTGGAPQVMNPDPGSPVTPVASQTETRKPDI